MYYDKPYCGKKEPNQSSDNHLRRRVVVKVNSSNADEHS